ncbi:hypothetical protein HUR95_12180 [Caldalkalibacillus thermarum TA2.A1]|uniref:Uncharacterized protein n=1 Tax=Caldalkalibacillus thermarum (strain TA2.A1) TaxID=986075 RepID=A0A8X8L9M4_CALTT|nr:hypothetical protein [Caldalkalibacillus thermarum]QZT33068.1 hypothetical protein HUR95_12180 [Caldalkalibacillus thermarum TA2.A1]
MEKNIEKVLSEKGIKVSKDELSLLEHQWNAIQQLKKGFKEIKLDDSDICVTHNPGSVCHE